MGKKRKGDKVGKRGGRGERKRGGKTHVTTPAKVEVVEKKEVKGRRPAGLYCNKKGQVFKTCDPEHKAKKRKNSSNGATKKVQPIQKQHVMSEAGQKITKAEGCIIPKREKYQTQDGKKKSAKAWGG